MSINPEDIQSIADAGLIIRALQKRHAAGHDVIADINTTLGVIEALECQTVDDALVLMDIAQQLSANMFIESGGDVDHPHDGSDVASNSAVIVGHLGRAIQAINATMVAHSIDTDRPAN